MYPLVQHAELVPTVFSVTETPFLGSAIQHLPGSSPSTTKTLIQIVNKYFKLCQGRSCS